MNVKQILPAVTGRLLVLVLFLLCASSAAYSGRSWSVSGEEDFSKGELDGVSVLSSGEMRLAPPIEEVRGLDANFVWDVKTAEDGRMLVSTGAPGALYSVEDGEAKRLYRTSEDHALSVLPLPDGSVLLGTAPRGIIYRVAKDGDVTVFADLDVNYVWAMAAGENGMIFCATGAQGKLLRLTPDGDVSEVFNAPQENLLSMAVDGNRDRIYVGTQPDGIVYEVEKNGDYSVLFDAEESEIRDLILAEDGALYAATAQGERSPTDGDSASKPDGSTQVPAPGGQRGTDDLLPGKPSTTNSVYRIDPETGAYRIARFQDEQVLALAYWDDEILAGTGDEGRLLGLGEDGRTRVVLKTDTRHTSALAGMPDGNVLVGTSNPGRLFRVNKGYRKEGTYVSHVFDADYLSRWGTVSRLATLQEETEVKMHLRTGNSQEPDPSWSDWKGPAEGEDESRVGVPMGRFAQVKITLLSEDPMKTPEVNSFSVHYRQANRRPVIEEFGIQESDGGQSGAAGSSSKEINWSVSDPNEDEVECNLYYKGVEEREWKELKTGIRDETSYSWDTVRTPDGYYMIKLVATDRPSRGITEALQDEKVFGPFLVDNGPPELRKLEAVQRQNSESYVITGVAYDRTSKISSIQVSHNSGEWEAVFPDDEMFDSREESFTFVTPQLEEGEHVFVFIAEDAAENTGSGKILIDISE